MVSKFLRFLIVSIDTVKDRTGVKLVNNLTPEEIEHLINVIVYQKKCHLQIYEYCLNPDEPNMGMHYVLRVDIDAIQN